MDLSPNFIEFLSTLQTDGVLTNYQIQYIYNCLYDNTNITENDILKQYGLTTSFNEYNKNRQKNNQTNSQTNGQNRLMDNNNNRQTNGQNHQTNGQNRQMDDQKKRLREREMQNVEYACAQNRDQHTKLKKEYDALCLKLNNMDQIINNEDRQKLNYLRSRHNTFPDNPSFPEQIDQIKRKYISASDETSLLSNQRDLTRKLTELDSEHAQLLQRKEQMSQ